MCAVVGKRKVIESENGAKEGSERVALHLGQGIKGIWKAVLPICASDRKVKGLRVCAMSIFSHVSLDKINYFRPRISF